MPPLCSCFLFFWLPSSALSLLMLCALAGLPLLVASPLDSFRRLILFLLACSSSVFPSPGNTKDAVAFSVSSPSEAPGGVSGLNPFTFLFRSIPPPELDAPLLSLPCEYRPLSSWRCSAPRLCSWSRPSWGCSALVPCVSPVRFVQSHSHAASASFRAGSLSPLLFARTAAV